MSNPKFLNLEKKSQLNIRLPQRLIDKLNGYADLTGKTTTNIINKVLDDFLSDKVVLNDYLDNMGGISVKIPFSIYQKNRFTIDDNERVINLTDYDLLSYNNSSTYQYIINDEAGVLCDEMQSERLDAELFEVKKIPNNLDINVNGSYVANKKILKFNQNAIHSGIELFVYNIAEMFFADGTLTGEFDSFDNALYCLYFEVAPDNSVTIHLIDYLTAINLLSASGNDEYKDLIIACVTELNELNDIGYQYFNELDDRKNDLTFDSEIDYAENYEFEVEQIEKELYDKYLNILKFALSDVAKKYNSNNIIKFGSDIFKRLAIKDIKSAPNGFLDEIVDELVDEKFEITIDERLNEIIDAKIDAVFNDKFDELEKTTANIDNKIDKINNVLISLKD